LLLGLILGWSFLAATAPAAQPTTAPAHPRVAPALKPADFDAARLLVVHYRRLDDNYTDWNLWAWVEGQEGKAIQFADVDSFGRYAVVPLPDGAAQAGIIVRKGEWVQKDIDQDRFVKLPADQSVTEVWLVSGDATIYDDPTKIDYTVRLVGAFLDAIDRITFASSAPLSEAQRASVRVATVDGATTFSTASVEMRDEPASTRPVYDVRLDRAVPQGDIAKLTLSVDGLESLTVFARDVLNGTAFLPLDAVLGYQYAPEQTTFQTWSPVAEAVELLLYDGLAAGEPSKTITLTAGEKGLWRAVVPGDLHGRAYRYRFTSYGKQRVVPDIHCFAANVDSTLSVVDDLNRLVPDGWGQTPQPTLKQPTDEIIYEVHTRDFSIADASCPPALRGTYLGLVHKNPAPPATTSSGLSHLKDLGVTAIHLLPSTTGATGLRCSTYPRATTAPIPPTPHARSSSFDRSCRRCMRTTSE
jgi:pullulanase